MHCAPRASASLSLVSAVVAVVVVAVVVVAAGSIQPVTAKRECVTIRPGNVKKLAQESHVLLKVDRKSPRPKSRTTMGDDDDNADNNDTDDNENENDDEWQYKELCSRYATTPARRTTDLVVGQFVIDVDALRGGGDKDDDDNANGDSSGQRHQNDSAGEAKKAMDIATKLGAGDMDEWPTYVLLKKGTKEASDAIRYDGNQSKKTADAISSFVREQIDVKVGSMLYYIETLDRMAARFMSVVHHDDNDNNDDNGGKTKGGGWKAQAQRYLYAYVSKFMIALYRGEAKDVASLYDKIFTSVLIDGSSYASTNANRLENMLRSDKRGGGKGDMSFEKREEVAQRLHILKKFVDPVVVTKEQNRAFFLALAWYSFSIGAVLVLVVSLILDRSSSPPSLEEKKEEEGEEEARITTATSAEKGWNEGGAETKEGAGDKGEGRIDEGAKGSSESKKDR